MILSINKPIGITSYDVIRKLKKIYPGQKIGHAGTLDPLADGVLICLIGQDTKRQNEFMGQDKTYRFITLFGFETDTFDILGKILETSKYDISEIEPKIAAILDTQFKGEILQTLPVFSAVKKKGVPLYRAKISGDVEQKDLEKREVNIKDIKILGFKEVSRAELLEQILNTLDTVKKGFRQGEIAELWKQTLNSGEQNINEKYLIAEIEAEVSKGTYVRSIAQDLGKVLGINACTINISRIAVGDIKMADAIPLDKIEGFLKEIVPKHPII